MPTERHSLLESGKTSETIVASVLGREISSYDHLVSYSLRFCYRLSLYVSLNKETLIYTQIVRILIARTNIRAFGNPYRHAYIYIDIDIDIHNVNFGLLKGVVLELNQA